MRLLLLLVLSLVSASFALASFIKAGGAVRPVRGVRAQRPPQCQPALNDRMAYPLEIPQLGTFGGKNETIPSVYLVGPMRIIHPRTTSRASRRDGIFLRGDAKIGRVQGVVRLENMGRCQVLQDGREALFNMTVTEPQDLSLIIAPWRRVRVRHFYLFTTKAKKRLFSVVRHFPRPFDQNTVVTFSVKHKYARMELDRFPLLNMLKDLRGQPAARLVLRNSTLKTRFDFGLKGLNAAKAFTTIRGYLNLKPLTRALFALNKLRNVRAKATFVKKGFELKAPIDKTLSIVKGLVQMEEPELHMFKFYDTHISYKQNLKRNPTQIFLHGRIVLLGVKIDTDIKLDSYHSEMQLHFPLTKNAPLLIRGSTIGNGPVQDFRLSAVAEPVLLDYFTEVANEQIHRAMSKRISMRNIGFNFEPFVGSGNTLLDNKIKHLEEAINDNKVLLKKLVYKLKASTVDISDRDEEMEEGPSTAVLIGQQGQDAMVRISRKIEYKEEILSRVAHRVARIETKLFEKYADQGTKERIENLNDKLIRVQDKIDKIRGYLNAKRDQETNIMLSEIRLEIAKYQLRLNKTANIDSKIPAYRKEVMHRQHELKRASTKVTEAIARQAKALEKEYFDLKLQLLRIHSDVPDQIAQLRSEVSRLEAHPDAKSQPAVTAEVAQELQRLEKMLAKRQQLATVLSKIEPAITKLKKHIANNDAKISAGSASSSSKSKKGSAKKASPATIKKLKTENERAKKVIAKLTRHLPKAQDNENKIAALRTLINKKKNNDIGFKIANLKDKLRDLEKIRAKERPLSQSAHEVKTKMLALARGKSSLEAFIKALLAHADARVLYNEALALRARAQKIAEILTKLRSKVAQVVNRPVISTNDPIVFKLNFLTEVFQRLSAKLDKIREGIFNRAENTPRGRILKRLKERMADLTAKLATLKSLMDIVRREGSLSALQMMQLNQDDEDPLTPEQRMELRKKILKTVRRLKKAMRKRNQLVEHSRHANPALIGTPGTGISVSFNLKLKALGVSNVTILRLRGVTKMSRFASTGAFRKVLVTVKVNDKRLRVRTHFNVKRIKPFLRRVIKKSAHKARSFYLPA